MIFESCLCKFCVAFQNYGIVLKRRFTKICKNLETGPRILYFSVFGGTYSETTLSVTLWSFPGSLMKAENNYEHDLHDFWEQAETIVYKIIFTLKMSFLEKFFKNPNHKE